MKTEDFDKKFDEGKEDIIDDLNLSQMRRPGHDQQHISIDLPLWMVEALDQEATRLGLSRQSVIQAWLAEHLEHAS